MLNIARKRVIVWFIPIMVSIFISGCGTEGDPILGQPTSDTIYAPAVVAVTPLDAATGVFYDTKHITAEFSVPMDNTTLTSTSFTLFDVNSSSLVAGGTVVYANRVADLTLDANLSQSTIYRATITTDAKDADGIALSSDYVWTFTTGILPDPTVPEVISTSPRNGDLNVSRSKIVTATFSEAMVSSTITASGTFTLMETTSSTDVNGTVSYSVINKIASFDPASDLLADTNYTAIITTTATDLSGKAMASDYNWTFETGSEQPELVALGLAAPFGIASTAGVTNTGATQIDGDAVLNPTATCNGVDILFSDNPGFGLCDGKAPIINGDVITPTNPDTITAQPVTDDLRAAYLSITPANMPGGTSLPAGTTLGNVGGSALVEGDNLFYTGVYTSNTSILITGELTLDAKNDPDATFVFQSASTVGTAPNARILLINGAKASNVYWQAASDATLETNTVWNGNILAYRSITMVTGTTSCGRLFAGAGTDGLFVFDSNRVSVPGNINSPTTCK